MINTGRRNIMKSRRWGEIVEIALAVILLILFGIGVRECTRGENEGEGRELPLEVEGRDYVQTVKVKVISWGGKHFDGVIVDACNHDVLCEGDTVTVNLDVPDVKVYYREGIEFEYDMESGNLNSCNIAIGSRIEVKFKALAYKDRECLQIFADEIRELAE